MNIIRSSLYRPSGLGQRLAVSAAAVQFQAFDASASAVYFEVQGAAVRISIDGVAPSGVVGSQNGMLFQPGDSATWSMESIKAAKFVRDGGVDAVIQAYPLA